MIGPIAISVIFFVGGIHKGWLLKVGPTYLYAMGRESGDCVC